MLLLDAIDQVEKFVTVFATVYALVLVFYVLLSWFRVPPSLGPIQRFLYDVCEPYLRFWRRLLPFSFGAIDFSPMVAIIAVYAAGRLVNLALGQLH
jgi:YggT family protein